MKKRNIGGIKMYVFNRITVNPQLPKRIGRINEISKQASDDINKYLSIKDCEYSGFDFEFKPYQMDKAQAKRR